VWPISCLKLKLATFPALFMTCIKKWHTLIKKFTLVQTDVKAL